MRSSSDRPARVRDGYLPEQSVRRVCAVGTMCPERTRMAARTHLARSVGWEDNHDTHYPACGMRRGVCARRTPRLRTVRQCREGGRRLQLRRGRRRGPRHQGLPFGRRQADLRHRHPHRRQRLLRPGLCRGEGRRRPDRRQHPAARLGIADRRPGARDRDPEPDRAGPDHRRADHDHAAGRRLQRHRQGRRGVRHPGRHHQLVRRHHPEPQRHQPHRPGRVRGRDRRRGAGRVPARRRASNRARSCCRRRRRWATSRSTTG